LEQLPSNTILVVDDNEQVCSLIAHILRDGGYEVVEAHDAAEALRMLPMRPPPLLLVTDVVMPGLSGFELASHIIAACNIPVLFVSAHEQTGSDIPGPLLQKPFTAEALLDVVARLLALTSSSVRQPT
jgi:CheY-like chemotaxis protein